MRFRLILKQAIRDFKSKLQLYVSFTLFLIVCLSIIIGLLTFFNTYSSFYNNVFDGFDRNTNSFSFKFVDQETNVDNSQFNFKANNYLHDDGEFEDWIYKDLLAKDESDSDSSNYIWGNSFSDKQIEFLKGNTTDKENLINFIGDGWGSVNLNAIKGFYNGHKDSLKDLNKSLLPNKDGITKVWTEDHNAFKDAFNRELKSETDNTKLTYLALIKLNRISTPSFSILTNSGNTYRTYNGDLENKFQIEYMANKPDVKKELTTRTALNFSGGMNVDGTNNELTFSVLPGMKWMGEDYKSTPWQYKNENTEGMWVEDSTPKNFKLPDNKLYGYMTPSYMHAHGYKIGDTFELPINDGSKFLNITIAGSGITEQTFYRDKNHGTLFLPIEVLNMIDPIDSFEVPSNSNVPSCFNPGTWTDKYAVQVYGAKTDTKKARYQAASLLMSNFYKDSRIDNLKTIDGREFVPGWDLWSDKAASARNIWLFRLLCYVLSAGVAILTIVVFWFVASETIKLQKNTLWFLKALGENRFVLSLLTTFSIMVPFLIGAILSIFGSLGISFVMNSAVSFNYAFYVSGWTFNLFSFVVFIVISIASFLIFLGLNVINLRPSALSLHSDNKVGLITRMYMRTKGLYKVLPTGGRIGISFIVQNIFKNILTLVLLLLSFSVVLFAMQFSSSARASAHSYENRNKPYSSLMMNKLNENDAIGVNRSYLTNTLNVAIKNEKDLDTLNEISAGISTLYGKGYTTSTVDSYKSDELSVQGQAYKYIANPRIDNNPDLNEQVIMSAANIIAFGYNYKEIPDINDALFSKFLTQSYMANEILNSSISPQDISNEVFNDKFTKNNKPEWWDRLTNKFNNPDSLNLDKGDVDLLKVLVEQIRNQDVVNKVFDNLKAMIIAANIANGSELTPEQIAKIEQTINSWKETYNWWINNTTEEQTYKLFSNGLEQIKVSFNSTINGLRSAYTQVKQGIGNGKNINLNVFFNNSIIPEDISSIYSTDFLYKGFDVSGIGLDKRDEKTYNRLVKPYGIIPEETSKDLNELHKYEYTGSDGNSQSINVHIIHGYISGKFSNYSNINKGDIIQLGAIKSPKPNEQLPNVFLKVDKVIDESSVYNEIYFNKKDYLNYLKESLKNNWDKSISDQMNNNEDHHKGSTPYLGRISANDANTLEAKVFNIADSDDVKQYVKVVKNSSKDVKETLKVQSAKIEDSNLTIKLKEPLNYNDNVIVNYKDEDDDINLSRNFTYKLTSNDETVIALNSIAQDRQILELDDEIDQVKNNPLELNNAVYSYGEIPYSLSHLTLGAKTGVGYSLLDYVSLPILNYSSDQYPVNYSNSIYIFRLVTQELMKNVQPVITTLNRLVAVLLIVTFVVALILINLILLQNRQTILLFKAMGYKKREVDWYLLSGYIVADILGLAAGILVSYFVVKYASTYALNMFHISLYPVWSWQFILTAVLMAVVFIIMILVSVTWYTDKQKPRDAFATL